MADDRPLLTLRGVCKSVRWDHTPSRHHLRRAAGEMRRPRRPERCRQDDAVQLRLRAARTEQGDHRLRRACARRAADLQAGPAGDRSHVPAHRGLHRHVPVRDHLIVAERARRRRGRLGGPAEHEPAPTRRGVAGVDETTRAGGHSPTSPIARSTALGLGQLPPGRAGAGPGGENRRFLLADEPSSGLDLRETADGGRGAASTCTDGTAVLLVEHDLGMVADVVRPGRGDGPRQHDRQGRLRRGDGRPRRSATPTWGRARGRAPVPEARRPLVQNVSAGYGPYRALFDVSFRRPARVASWPSSAPTAPASQRWPGRSPDWCQPTVGHGARWPGTDVTRLPAYRIARLGVAHVVEGRGVFSSLTVEENLALCLPPARRAPPARGKPRPRLRGLPASWASAASQAGSTLSGGQQRLLSLAKVLVVPPKLLVADELSLGLAPVVVDAGLRRPARDQPQRHRPARGRAAGRPGAPSWPPGPWCWTGARVAFDGEPDEARTAINELPSRDEAGARAAALVGHSPRDPPHTTEAAA